MKNGLSGLLIAFVFWFFSPLGWAQPVALSPTENQEKHLKTHRSQEQQNIVPEPDIPQVHEEPQPSTSQEASPQAGTKTVNETRLWRLLRQQQYGKLRQEIRHLHHNNPNWRPPRKLLVLLAAGEARQAVDAALVKHAEQAQLADLRYAFDTSRLSAAFDAKDFAAALAYEEKLAPEVQRKHDANFATLLGWSHFHVQHWSQAAEWFSQAVIWNERQEDSVYGLALTQFEQGHFREAETLARRCADTSEKMRSLLGEVLLARARESRERKEFHESLALVQESEQYRAGGRETSSLKAWDAYDLGETVQAAREFAALYRSQPDDDSAQGALYSYMRKRDWPGLERLASETPGPLTPLWSAALGQRAYEHQLFLLAHRTASDSLPQLRNLDGPTIASGLAYRHKSGARGLGRLDEENFPFTEGTFVYEGMHTLSLHLSRVTLDSGHLPANARIGSVPRNPTAYSVKPTTRLRDGVEPHLTYTLVGWLSPYAELGLTPSEGEVSLRPTWRLGLAQEQDAGHWNVETFSQPVKESLLSYTGIVDPYSGRKWGRVRQTGASLSGYEEVQKGWGVSGQATIAMLRGFRVPENYHVGLSVGLTRTFTPSGFEYLALGPRMAFDHYQKNLSQFTLGHGGYFSPSHLVQFTAAMNFLTQEAQQFIATGDLSVGVQTHHEESSPFFPHNVLDGRRYSARNESGPVVAAEFTSVWRLSDHWQIGGGALVRKTANYDDWSAMFFVRFLLEPRPVVLSTDNPHHLLHTLY